MGNLWEIEGVIGIEIDFEVNQSQFARQHNEFFVEA